MVVNYRLSTMWINLQLGNLVGLFIGKSQRDWKRPIATVQSPVQRCVDSITLSMVTHYLGTRVSIGDATVNTPK